LLDELENAIESDGSVSDRASPEIRQLRTEVANLRARLIAKLEEILHEKAAILSDGFYTERDGRYVVPVRRDAHETLPGIVHGTSASGHSVFVEPRALVPFGNRLKMAQGELDREITRLLAVLSELAAERLPSLMAAADAIDHADLRGACARLGEDLRARVIDLCDDAEIDLKAARHPLLLLDGVDVVPNDLPIGAGRALVLSGPNAGGKTVALKTLGLAALMMRAGLPIPAGDGSRCGFFTHVASDVGDDQNLHKNLSTFSAHVTRLVRMLDECQPGALLLMDELAGGTDPEEGSALACALVDTLCRRGGAVAVTTHYEALKAMAMRDDRLMSAAVGFNVAAMLPTFEVTLGMPGASSALDVARRFGVPEIVIERARAVLPEQTRDFDQLVRSIEVLREQTQRSLSSAAERERAAEALHQKAQAKLDALMVADQRSVERATTKLFDDLRDLRERIKEARKSLREARDEQTLQSLLKSADDALRGANNLVAEARAGREEPRGDAAAVTPAGEADVVVGKTVHVARLGRSAVIVEGPLKGKVRGGGRRPQAVGGRQRAGWRAQGQGGRARRPARAAECADERGAQHPHGGQHPRSARHACGRRAGPAGGVPRPHVRRRGDHGLRAPWGGQRRLAGCRAHPAARAHPLCAGPATGGARRGWRAHHGGPPGAVVPPHSHQHA
jgi:DNA mismatch repair protein MutS2